MKQQHQDTEVPDRESLRQGTKCQYSDKFYEIDDGAMGILDYTDLIMEKNRKLSGIIDAIEAIDHPEVRLIDAGAAMHDYTRAIDKLATDLWDHVKSMGLLDHKEDSQQS